MKKSSIKILITSIACMITGAVSVFFLQLAPLVVIAGLIGVVIIMAIFRDPKAGVFFVAFLLPFERIGSFELMGVTIRASQIFALITIVAWILIFLSKKINFSARNPIIIPIFLLSGFSILSMINAVNLQRAVIIFIFNAFVMVVSLMIPNLVKTKNTLKITINIILFSCLIVSIFGVYQFLGDMAGLPKEITGLREHYTQEVFGFPRIQSTALEPLYFANYLLIPISIGIALILNRKKNKEKTAFNILWMIIVTSLAGINLILTLSRGGFLGLLVVLLLSSLFFFKSLFSFKKVVLIVAVSIIAIFSAFSFLKITGDEKNVEVFVEQATTFSEGVGVEERFSTYDEAIKMIKDHPLIGNGIGNFGPAVNKSPYHMPNEGWAIVNNEYLELWAEIGIFGLLGFIMLIFIVIIRTIKSLLTGSDRYLKVVLIGLFIAFIGVMAQYQTFSILYILHIWFLIGLLVAVQNLLLLKKVNN